MAASINQVVLVGRLTKDVEIRKTATGTSVCQFTVACDRRFAAKPQAQPGMPVPAPQQPTADFISCVAWRQRADFLGSYGRKGSLVGVEGSIQTRSYTNQAGQKVYVTEVVADNVELLESKQASQARQAAGYAQPQPQMQPAQQPAPQPQPRQQPQVQPAQQPAPQPAQWGYNGGGQPAPQQQVQQPDVPALDLNDPYGVSTDDLPF